MTESVRVTVPPTTPSVKVTAVAATSAGLPGKDAYQDWLDLGNIGTRADFLASLKGEDGTGFVIRFEVALEADLAGLSAAAGDAAKVDADGHIWTFTGSEWIDLGPITAGKSAYQEWLDAGNVGTVEQFLASLQGTDAVVIPADVVGGVNVTTLPAVTDIVGGSLIIDL